MCFVHLNGLPIAALTLKISNKNNWCLLKMVKIKLWLKNVENNYYCAKIFVVDDGEIISRMCIGMYNIVKLKYIINVWVRER